MSTVKKIVVGISLGDINGVGIEIILKTFSDKRMLDFCTPVLFGSSKVVSIHKKVLKRGTKCSWSTERYYHRFSGEVQIQEQGT